MIGVLGGMGPQAGIDLASKIVANTLATCDQDHIPTLLFGDPLIPDRTEFLFGKSNVNPAESMIQAVKHMAAAGASVIGVACNTAHSPPIFDLFQREINQALPLVTLYHLIDETMKGILTHFPEVKRVGILSTTATYKFRLYDDALIQHNLEPIRPLDIESLGNAIFDPYLGIKACSSPVTESARHWVEESVDSTIRQGAEAVILGCTELPLALPAALRAGVPLIDPSTFLARALIRAVAPDRLTPWRVA